MGQMSVDILGVGAGLHCWYSIGGRAMFRFSSISMGKKLENVALRGIAT